jgi:hypothetical protein
MRVCFDGLLYTQPDGGISIYYRKELGVGALRTGWLWLRGGY